MQSLMPWSRWRRARRTPVPLEPVLDGVADADAGQLDLRRHVGAPVMIESATLLRRRGRFFVRVMSRDGVHGVSVANERLAYLWPLMTQRVLPLVVGQDARSLPWLLDAIARHDGNYKLVGLPFWSCAAIVEIALLDMLGKSAELSVGELLGGVVRRDIPVYLSSLRRDTTPEQEVELLATRLAETCARAAKFKIGGRMGRFDAAPRRTEQLVALARKTLGDDVALLADANGSYTVDQAIEVGRMLEDHGVLYFEEPCPWEDFEATRQVADRLQRIQVTGGEQDASLEKFRWMIAHRGVDVVQPDVVNNGGFIRTQRVARLAAAAGVDVSLHSSRNDFLACYMLHMASATPNLTAYQEFLVDPPKRKSWFAPNFEVRSGLVAAPSGPGLGMAIDPRELARSRIVS